MIENSNGLYAAYVSKDTRFDGRFFVGISSTGIYCRPVCRAKQPKAENCTFYRTAAEADGHSRYWKLDGKVYCHAVYGMAGCLS